jgi:iron complex outermembrane receptor protein
LYYFFFVVSTFHTTLAQNKTKKIVELSTLLEKISNDHKIFFTYDANLISDKVIQEDGFLNLSLKESISLLEKLTPFHFDDLGNNYYVIYSDKESLNSLKAKGVGSNLKSDKIIVKGIVLSSDNTPLNGATLQDEKSLFGTITNRDGTFEFIIQKENNTTVSFLGHNSKKIQLEAKKFHTITLLSGQELDEIKIVGSRNKNRVANDTPVAIDFIDIKNTASKSSQIEINQFLQYAIPSFNATKQSGADGADHIDPATIRGLGPDQTLVLINGKRRHQASLINLHGTRGRGNSGTDLNAIPISAIKRIELLRDGASAQYGSDAIAGVINIVLKDSNDALTINSTLGFYNANTDNIFPNKNRWFYHQISTKLWCKNCQKRIYKLHYRSLIFWKYKKTWR